MPVSVTMPALGESVTEGTVTRWLKKEGETVEVDEPLLEVSTDKVDSEVPSPFAGQVAEILVEEGETVDVGTRLAVIAGEGAAAAAPAQPEAAQSRTVAESETGTESRPGLGGRPGLGARPVPDPHARPAHRPARQRAGRSPRAPCRDGR